jgi:hypothetical protein
VPDQPRQGEAGDKTQDRQNVLHWLHYRAIDPSKSSKRSSKCHSSLRCTCTIDYYGENMKLLPTFSFTASSLEQTWTFQTRSTRASPRGVSAPDARNVWANGGGVDWLVTTDASVTRRAARVPN